ncbi:MAG: biopolymer transporter ExbD [Paracoccaceae bacterium]
MLRTARQKRPISLTPLVDVIFLLLLFFMLSSTFSTFAEVELSAAAPQAGASDTAPVFLQLFPDRLTLNGETRTLDTLGNTLDNTKVLLLALQDGVTAQRLTDALVALRAYPDLSISVLGAS